MNIRIVKLLIIISILMLGCSNPQIIQPVVPSNKITEPKSYEGGLDQINKEALNHMMDGELYLDQGDFAMAIVELQEAQKLEPNVSTIYVSLAECYWNLNKPERSMEYLESAMEIDRKNYEAREMLAEQYFRLQDFEKAEEQYLILRDSNPENENYLFALGDLAKIQKKYDNAIDYYMNAYKINKNNLQALEVAVDLTHRLGKFEQADKLYQLLLKADSTNTKYLRAFSDVKLQQDNPNESIKLVKKIILIEGESVDNLTRLGVLYTEIEKDSLAIEVFQKILSKDSINAGGLHFLSTIFRENDEFVKAKYFADEMTNHHPQNSQGFVNSALVELEQENPIAAAEILKNVAPNFPEEYSVQYLLGMSYYQANDYKMAAAFLDNAREIAPNSRNVLHLLAIANDNMENWTISDGIYTQLIQTDSTDVQALNNFAYSLVERNEQLDIAEKYSRKAIELEPDQAAYLDTYGWVLFKLGDLTGARKYISKSIELESDNAEILEHMGDLLIKSNNMEEAIEYYKKAQILDPENEQITNKLNEL